MVPDLDFTSTEFPPEADDMAETPGASIQVDYARCGQQIAESAGMLQELYLAGIAYSLHRHVIVLH